MLNLYNRVSLDSLPKSEDFLWLWQVLLLLTASVPIANSSFDATKIQIFFQYAIPFEKLFISPDVTVSGLVSLVILTHFIY